MPTPDVAARIARTMTRTANPVTEWLYDTLHTQRWLARQCGVSRAGMRNYLSGYRRDRGGKVMRCPAPESVMQTVHDLSAGRICPADWPA